MNTQSPALFSPFKLRELTLQNRIVVSPMCQYSAQDGCAQDWHLMHIGNLCSGKSGMVIIEMTNVSAVGRITPNCLGLYNDETQAALQKVVSFCKTQTDSPIAVQLAHAGRKASTLPPWTGRASLAIDQGGWQPLAPSDVDFGDNDNLPRAMTLDEIAQLKTDFVNSTKRANEIGFDAIEVHAAHGYLLHQFLSPLTNLRDDQYGGSLENRMRLPLEIFAAMREVWPEEKPMGVRISATDWVDQGWDLSQSEVFAKELDKLNCDWLDVSSGGLHPKQRITTGPGYQLPFAEAIKKHIDMPIMSVGEITQAQQANQIIQNGQADLVAIGRAMLYNPRWTWHAATELNVDLTYPNQYLRCRPAN